MKIELPALTLVGIQERGPSSFNQSENGAAFGASVWEKFIPMVIQAGLSLNREMYGVSWPADENTPPQHVHYFVGFVKPDGFTGSGFSELELEGGAYFEYRFTGAPADIDQGFIAAYTQALPASGLISREGQHLEIYPDDYDQAASEITFRILIPVS